MQQRQRSTSTRRGPSTRTSRAASQTFAARLQTFVRRQTRQERVATAAPLQRTTTVKFKRLGARQSMQTERQGADLLFHQHPGGFSPAGMSRHDLDARPTPFRASDQLPPIVFESIHGLSSDVVFRQPLHQYLNEVRQDEAASRSKTETDDSALVQALVCHEEEPAPRTRTNGPVLFLS